MHLYNAEGSNTPGAASSTADFGRPGETQTSQKHRKTNGFWCFFDFELFAVWERFGMTFASKTTRKKLKKAQNLEKKRCWKRVVLFHRFFCFLSDFRVQKQVILDPCFRNSGGQKCQKVTFFKFLLGSRFEAFLGQFWMQKGVPNTYTHIFLVLFWRPQSR